jgi:uncharacterized protein YerC
MSRMSADDIKLIQEMRRDGYTYDEIVKEMNSSLITIRRICGGKTYGKEKVKNETGVRGMTTDNMLLIWRMRDEGKTYAEMCSTMCVSSKTLVKIFKLPRPT